MTMLLAIGIAAIVAALVAFRGLVLTFLWAWFLVPLGLPEIGVVHAIGIVLIAAMLTKTVDAPAGKDEEPHARLKRSLDGFSVSFGVTIAIWGIGYGLHLLMA